MAYEGAERSAQQHAETMSHMRKRMKPEGIDKILGNAEVWRRFNRYIKSGRTRDDGPMPPLVAIEEAVMDVFEGGDEQRELRRFRWMATDGHLARMKSLHIGKKTEVNEWLGDEVAVRSRVRRISEPSLLARLLLAEYQGRNETGEARDNIIAIIKARMNRVEANASAAVPTEAEKDAMLADDDDVPPAPREPEIEEG